MGGEQDSCPKITSAKGGDQGAPFLRKEEGGAIKHFLFPSKVGPIWFPTHCSLFLHSLSNTKCPTGVDEWERKPTFSFLKK